MKLVTFILGLIIGAILGFGFVIYWQSQEPSDETNIVFARKNFFDAKQNNEFDAVFISGTLTGKDQGYSNNTYGISCIKRFKTCFVAYVEQIGRDQIGRIQNPIDYPVLTWSENEVVAQEELTPLDLFGLR